MSEVRALIEQLVAGGIDPIDAAEIITRAAIVGAQAAGDKKSAGALRQERYRRNKTSQTVTVTDNDAVSPIPDKEAFPQTPIQEINPKSPPYSPPSGRQRFADPAIVLQSVLDPMTAKRWVDHLAQKRRPLTAPSAEELVVELQAVRSQGGNPVEAVTLAISRNWNNITVDYCRNGGMKFSQAAPDSAVDWRTWCEAFFGGASWPHGLGPKPDEPGCRAPADVVEQARKAAA